MDNTRKRRNPTQMNMFSGGSHSVYGGKFTMNVQGSNEQQDAFDLLYRISSPSAAYNAGHLYLKPKCHPNTRVAILNKIQKWILAVKDGPLHQIMWLHGAAGAGKTAIAYTIAEWCDDQNLLLASFFFWRSDASRNNIKTFVPTLAYAICNSDPPSRPLITESIARDPHIFSRHLNIQFSKLILEPLEALSLSFELPYVLIIDGLDECSESAEQNALLQLIEHAVQHSKLCLKVLISSRPEQVVRNAFDNTGLWNLSTRLALNENYDSYEDIRRFLEDKFVGIKSVHPRRDFIPIDWPDYGAIHELVQKSSGQFIYAKTVINYISFDYDSPVRRLKSILDASTSDSDTKDLPFAELDTLYTHILTSTQVANTETTCHVVAFCTMVQEFVRVQKERHARKIGRIMNMDYEKLCFILSELASLIDFNPHDGSFKVLHASLGDFLLDPSRSRHVCVDRRKLNTEAACYYLERDHWTYLEDVHTLLDILRPSKVIITPELAKCLAKFDVLSICHVNTTKLQSPEIDTPSLHYGKVILHILNVLKDLSPTFENGTEIYEQRLAVFDQWFATELKAYTEKSRILQALVATFPISSISIKEIIWGDDRHYDLEHLCLLTDDDQIWPAMLSLGLPKSQAVVENSQAHAIAAVEIIRFTSTLSSGELWLNLTYKNLTGLPILLGRAEKLSELIRILPSSTASILNKYARVFPSDIDGWSALKHAVKSYLERHEIPISEATSFHACINTTTEMLHFDQDWEQEGVAIATWNQFVSFMQSEQTPLIRSIQFPSSLCPRPSSPQYLSPDHCNRPLSAPLPSLSPQHLLPTNFLRPLSRPLPHELRGF